ncbi:unnamed protein product [Adineta ricciae]|uniref:G-protein coupled receptors family 1 profile domain-containing protein n=1 Tax=Adineta ricciae TaxID=249248 RepID=A0A813NM39_ADIRI|nr:unnamed protein product [Adineta ricciae]CAF0776167.1 unnamed protein product [Adineta ricciae]
MNTTASDSVFDFITKYSLYSSCLILTLGIFGNLLNILVFTKLKIFRSNRSAFYLTIESISNLLFLLYIISLNILIWIYSIDATEYYPIWCKLRYVLLQALILISYSMICCAAIDQYFSTNCRLHFRQVCTLKLTRYVASTLMCIWIAHSILFGCFSDIQPGYGCVLSSRIYRQYVTYFVYPVFIGLLPIFTASVFSLLAFRNVRHIIRRQSSINRRRLDRQMTTLVLTRVIIFVCLGTPYTSFRIYSLNSSVPRNKPMIFAIEQLLQCIFTFLIALNSSISFYIFAICSSRFRRQVKSVFVKKCWKRWKCVCCSRCPLNFQENQLASHSNMEYEDPN